MSKVRWIYLGHGRMTAAALGALLKAGYIPEHVYTGVDLGFGTAVGDIARDNGIPVTVIRSASEVSALETRSEVLDLGVCCGWSERLSSSLLQSPSHGWINLHPSSLPKWRGSDPVGWQLFTGESRLGVTVHRMSEEFDEGDILASGLIESKYIRNRWEGHEACGRMMGEMTGALIDQLGSGFPLSQTSQVHESATYCPPPGTVPLIDPSRMSAAVFARLANAFSPVPGIAVVGLGDEIRFSRPVIQSTLAEGDKVGTVVIGEEMVSRIACRDRWVSGKFYHSK